MAVMERPSRDRETVPGTVAHEALRLDRLFPGWHERIVLSKLDMDDPGLCIVGQGVPGYYDENWAVIKNDVEAVGEPEEKVIHAYVFNSKIPEWTTEIRRRR